MSIELQRAVNDYENFISAHGISEDVLNAYVQATKVALQTEKDREYGLKVSNRAKQIVNQFIFDKTGGTPWELEKFAFANKTNYQILDTYYEILLAEAQNKVVDSGFMYLERKREPKERFYMPRRKQFLKIGLTQALQGMIDDEYDILLMSLIPGAGKTTIEKFFLCLVIGWFPKDFNLFYSHSGDITRMFYDGTLDIVTNADDYSWKDIFPDLSVTRTDAKMEQFNVSKYKPFPSVQCTSVGSKNAGKVRASKFLLVDDMIGGIEEALNPNVLDKLWDKYAVDARQRKVQDTDGNNCKEIHIATRWSVNDVIGRIQRMYDGNKRVKVISVPDVDENGESNFDYEYGGFTKEFFEDQQLLMDDISYRCLYKQQPIEREGLLFPEDKIRRYLNLPHGETELITAQCDTKGKGTDYFVMPVLQKYGDDWYCVDCICDNTADYEMQYENAANILVNNKVQECEFERNAGGDRVAMEVNKRVESKGWICNITDVPTETNKEARIFQCSSWILQHIIFKDESLYSPKEPYGIMMSLLKQYSVSGKKQKDDVPDVLSNFAIRITKGSRTAKVEAIQNPFREAVIMVGKEEWKEISGYEGRYMVSNFGNVISCERYVKVCGGGKRLVKEKKLKQSKCPGGYSVVNLWKDNSRKMFLVHRLVAEAFLENKNKLPEVNHKDENKENNRVDNLEWCTSKYNANYGTRNKRMIKQKYLKAVIMLDLSGNELKRFESLGDASRETGFDISAIIRVCKGRQKNFYGVQVEICGLEEVMDMAISKEVLIQYSDLQKECKEVREKIEKLEKQIDRIEKDGNVIDKVRGGDGGIQSFKIEGFPYPEYSRKKTLLYARKATLSELEMELLETLNEVETFIASVKDSHMRRIISLRVVDGLSWNEVADHIGGGNTEDSTRKAFNRFMS